MKPLEGTERKAANKLFTRTDRKKVLFQAHSSATHHMIPVQSLGAARRSASGNCSIRVLNFLISRPQRPTPKEMWKQRDSRQAMKHGSQTRRHRSLLGFNKVRWKGQPISSAVTCANPGWRPVVRRENDAFEHSLCAVSSFWASSFWVQGAARLSSCSTYASCSAVRGLSHKCKLLQTRVTRRR